MGGCLPIKYTKKVVKANTGAASRVKSDRDIETGLGLEGGIAKLTSGPISTCLFNQPFCHLASGGILFFCRV